MAILTKFFDDLMNHITREYGFYSESAICLSNLQISKKSIPNYYPKHEIFGDLTNTSHFLKKRHL